MPDLHIAGYTFTPVDDESSERVDRSGSSERADQPGTSEHADRSESSERVGRARPPERADRADRAQQFMPFAALRGYYDMVRERERVVEPRRELSDDEMARLSRKFMQVGKGMMVTTTHYDRDAYVKTTGVVTGVDATFRTLTIVRTVIALDDIIDIEGVGIDEDALG